MENQEINNQEDKQAMSMSAKEVAIMLSDTLRDINARNTTLRKAVAVSRIAMALAKVIEAADLEERIQELEQRLNERDKAKQ
jgi:hypothetical protein